MPKAVVIPASLYHKLDGAESGERFQGKIFVHGNPPLGRQEVIANRRTAPIVVTTMMVDAKRHAAKGSHSTDVDLWFVKR